MGEPHRADKLLLALLEIATATRFIEGTVARRWLTPREMQEIAIDAINANKDSDNA